MAEQSTTDRPAIRNRDRTRRAILDATVRSLNTHGGAVTLADVAVEAGVSKSGLLHHFPTRDALLLAVAVDAIDQFRAEVTSFLDLAENKPGKLLRAYIRALCGGSELAMSYFAYSALWNTLHMIPGVAQAFHEDAERWTADLERDGLHPDRILIARNAAEGLAANSHYDPSITADRLAHGRAILLALTDDNTALADT